MKESEFQSHLIKKLKAKGFLVLKNDPDYIQGIPDLLVLGNGKWAALECKRSASASHQPNQDYWVSRMNDMSYANFICPENEEEILDEVQRSLATSRKARLPRSK